ncbi:hypothetical protein SBV1_2230029 [Verrucomicrobia bacterium]|nr:hypothetical protein SBV1_2230029 [Verrucomicrobiota bacterium]
MSRAPLGQGEIAAEVSGRQFIGNGGLRLSGALAGRKSFFLGLFPGRCPGLVRCTPLACGTGLGASLQEFWGQPYPGRRVYQG